MLPARTQLPNVIPEDSEESDDDVVPPMQAPITRAMRRLSETVPVRKQTPTSISASTSKEAELRWRAQSEQPAFKALAKHLEDLDEEASISPTRSRAPSNTTHDFPCPRLPDSVISNMLRLSVLSEGNSRFGVVSKFINKATMANYAVVEWNVKGMDKKSVQDIIDQVEFLSTLRHRRIGSVYGYYVGDGQLSIFRTFLPTGAVADQLKVAPLLECIAQRYFRQLLEALEFLHGRNVIHGDIKTSNLLVTLSGDIQVTDISLPHAPVHEKHRRRTLFHCAPEMFRTMSSWVDASPAADIWASGCVLVAMVTRYAPFQDLFLSLSTQELHEKLFEAHQPDSPFSLNYRSRTLIPTSSKELADVVNATFERDPLKRLTASQLLERYYASNKPRKASRISQSTRGSEKRDAIDHKDLYNDEPTPRTADDTHKSLLQRLYDTAERRDDGDDEKPLKTCMKWYGSRAIIFGLLLLKWVAMVLLAALSLGFVAGSVFLAIYVIYSGIGVICQCQLNEGFVVLIALILLPIIILLTTLCVNNSCEKYKQAQEDGSLEKSRFVYPRPEDDIILCGIIVIDGRKEERKTSVRRKLAGDETDPTAATNLPFVRAFVRGVAGIA